MLNYIARSLICLNLICFSFTTLSQTLEESTHSKTSQNEETQEITVKDFFRQPEIVKPRISPNGDKFSYEYFRSVMIGSSKVVAHPVYAVSGDYWFLGMEWIGNNVLMLKRNNKETGKHSFVFIEVGFDEGEGAYKVLRENEFLSSGYLIDPLMADPESILFARRRYNEDEDLVFTDVHRISIFDEGINKLRYSSRLNRRSNSGEIYSWITNKAGQLVAGVSYKKGIPSVWFRKGKSDKLYKIWTGMEKFSFSAYGLSEDGENLWVLTNYKTDTVVARSFNLREGEFGDILYQKEGVDLKGIRMDKAGSTPLAVIYLEKGQTSHFYLNKEAENYYKGLQQHFEGEKYLVIGLSRNLRHQLVFSWSDSNTGKLHVCSSKDSNCLFLGDTNPVLNSIELASTKSFTVKTDDGFEVESFISLPKTVSDEKIPLIVMPHGGPIGVQDNSHYSGDVLWLAHNGYAVLQVNYRGSSGYGKTFKLEGMQQWGRAIEDDIEAALAKALQEHSILDGERVCLYGGSYGGYSAIMGIIRSPEKYRCAASFAGVTDLPLRFNKRSILNDEYLTNSLIQIVGDPKTQMQELMNNSPVYQFEKITRPLFLAHGTTDDRVDVEHSWRLRRMLQLADIEHEWLIMDDVGHGFSHLDEVKQFYDKLMPFLDKHLKGDVKELSNQPSGD